MSDYPEFANRMTHPRYTGLATFMRAPYQERFEGIDIGLIGVPFDGGVTNRPGARHGPREIRNQSSLIRRLIGGDVVEVAPPFDPSGNTALVGATMMFEILCVVADAVAKRKG